MMTTLHIVISVAKHTFIKVIRNPVTLTFSFIQPMAWMLFFGFLFHRFSLGSLDPSITYLDFLLPGICGMTVLFGASQSGISIIKDIQTGFLFRILRTPANRSAVLFGKITADIIRLIFQAIVVCLLGILVGAKLNINFTGVLPGLVALILFAWLYASVSCLIAIKTRMSETMAAFIHVVNMPILFTSTALVPAKQMPAWLENIAQWNPLTIVVNYIRDGLIFGGVYSNHLGLLLLLILAIVFFAITSMAFNKIKME